MNSPQPTKEVVDPPRRRLLDRLHRTVCNLDRQQAMYEDVCEERDTARHDRDKFRRRVNELEHQVAALEGEVARLTDENTALRRRSLEVSGPARHTS